MSASIRVLIAALAVGALAGCARSPESTGSQPQASAGASTEPGTIVPRNYYGRTEFEIPGGDGQVVDYTFG